MSMIRARSLFARVALVSSMLSIGCGGGSSAEGGSTGEQTAGGESESMTLDAFALELARQASPQLCAAHDAPLRGCYEVSAEQCDQLFTLAMTECVNQLRAELPATVDDPNVDATATPISECAGAAYRLGLEQNGLVHQTPECQPQG